MNEPMSTEQRRERDRATMDAVDWLFRKRGVDVDEQPTLLPFDEDAQTPGYKPDRMSRYIEIMGRPPLHAEEDRAALDQGRRRRNTCQNR